MDELQQEIEQSLLKILLGHTHPKAVMEVAAVIVDAIKNTVTAEQHWPAESIGNKRFRMSISFGEGNHIGEIHIGDITGRDKNEIHITVVKNYNSLFTQPTLTSARIGNLYIDTDPLSLPTGYAPDINEEQEGIPASSNQEAYDNEQAPLQIKRTRRRIYIRVIQ